MRPDINKIFRTRELTLDDVVGFIKKHVASAYDAYIPICGREGKGKSHLSIQLMLRYLGIPLDSPEALVALEKNVRYAENCSVFKALKFYLSDAQDGGCYVFDEAERMASKYDSSRLEARVIRRYWTLSRARRIVSFLNLPLLSNFDIYLRSGRAFMALNCVSKLDENHALAVVLYGDEDAADAFYLKRYYKLKEKMKKPTLAMTPVERVKLWARLPSFAGILIYNPLPPVLEQRYFELAKTTRQYKSILEELKEETSYMQLYQGSNLRRPWQ